MKKLAFRINRRSSYFSAREYLDLERLNIEKDNLLHKEDRPRCPTHHIKLIIRKENVISTGWFCYKGCGFIKIGNFEKSIVI